MKTPAERFESARAKILNEIRKHAAEGRERDNARKIYGMINRLDDLSNTPELRGTVSVEGLRAQVETAEETAYAVRQNARSEQIRELRLAAIREFYDRAAKYGR